MVWAGAKMRWWSGRVAELADAKDLGSFGEILAGSIPVAPTPSYLKHSAGPMARSMIQERAKSKWDEASDQDDQLWSKPVAIR